MPKIGQSGQNGKYKLQFIVDQIDFQKFEAFRKEMFSSTSKQHLLRNEMFLPWLRSMERKIAAHRG